MDDLWLDLRSAAVRLRTEKGWTLLCVVTLALGVGANSAIFSVVDHTLLRPLPFRDAERLVTVWGVEASTSDHQATSYPDYLDFRRSATSGFEGLGVYRGLELALAAKDVTPERLPAAAVSESLFAVLGVAPLLGRTFTPEEDRPGAAGAVILSEAIWRERWGARRDILGQAVVLDGTPRSIVGVMPASFRYPSGARLWVPAGPLPRNDIRGVHAYGVLARLRPGVTMRAASAELSAVAEELARAHPDDDAGRGVRLQPLRDSIVGATRPAFLLLLGASLLVLLLTCANLAALLATRGARRGKELAVRSSLGASRSRLVRQLLAETLAVGALGALSGLALAWLSVPALLSLAPADLPRLDEVSFDVRVAGVCLAMSLGTALLFGLAPALLVTRVSPGAVLRAESARATAGAGRLRLRRVMSLTQTAIAVVLLIGGGLLVRSLWALQRVEPGFRTKDVLTAGIQLPESRYPGWHESAAFFDTLLSRARGLPGVDAAAIASGAPFDEGWGARFAIEGRAPFPKGREPEPAVRLVSDGYLGATGIRLLRGRAIDSGDRAGEGVVMINEAMARRYFPGEDPIGRTILRRWWAPDMPERWRIVGLVGDVRTGSLAEPAPEAIYYPCSRVSFGTMTLLVASARDAAGLADELRAVVRRLDPELPLTVARTSALLDDSLGPRRFQVTLLVLFAALSLALAATGLFGVVSAAVAQRQREIALRLTLGAQRKDVVSLVASEAARVCGSGLVLGLAGALTLSSILRHMLFGVGPADLATLAAVTASLALVAGLACLVPIARALGVDPAVSLRGE